MAAEGTPKKVFSLENAAKRTSQTQDSTNSGGGGQPAKKTFKLSEMKLEAPRQTTQRAPATNGPVQVAVYKITEQSGDLWAQFPDTTLFQVGVSNSICKKKC